jgi:hypothetical protein
MINDRRLLAIADYQKVLNIRPKEGISMQSHVFRESQDAHLTPQNQMREGRISNCCSRTYGHH